MRALPLRHQYHIVLTSLEIVGKVDGFGARIAGVVPPEISRKLFLQNYYPVPYIAVIKSTALVEPLFFLTG